MSAEKKADAEKAKKNADAELEQVNQEATTPETTQTKKATTASSQKNGQMPTWLRPMTAVFSVIGGLMYAVGAFFSFLILSFYGMVTKWDEATKAKEVERLISKGMNAEHAKESIEYQSIIAHSISEHLSSLFTLFLGFIACLALILLVSGVGLWLKKAWSLLMGRTVCITLIASMILLILLNHSAFTTISNDILAQIPKGTEKASYSWMTSVRFIFLLSLVPMSLLFAYNMILKNVIEKKS